MKKCSRCHITKELSNFFRDKTVCGGYKSGCKQCRSLTSKTPEVKARIKLNRDKPERKEKVRLKRKLRRQTDEAFRKKEYKEHVEYVKRRKQTDINFDLADRLRGRLSSYLRRKNLNKHGSSIENLGCTVGDLKLHLEKQFQPGMSWENRHLWHIDHIKPLSSFDLTDPDQFKAANHFSNLQPLWAADNIRKGNKVQCQPDLI